MEEARWKEREKRRHRKKWEEAIAEDLKELKVKNWQSIGTNGER